eukprot:TRINITY_DN20856_c0_g1_i1.p1 TRINITY_DN20856_c0_g1~~TRINITY_DN20856_c0_g1_i1.p1  ORF type:complete len:223 (+),score=32.55 TRINITY_DN20856_c0_g1_i1:1567-2235(+)
MNVKTIELNEPKVLLEDCMNVISFLINYTEVDMLYHSQHKIDIQAFRKLKHQFRVCLTLNKLEIIWKNGEPPVFNKLLQALNWVETGLGIYQDGVLAFVFSLQPRKIHEQVLFSLKKTSKYFVSLLLKAMGNEDCNVRKVVVSALGLLGQAGLEVVNTLKDALGDKDVAVQEAATSALGQLGQPSPEVLNVLNSMEDEGSDGEHTQVPTDLEKPVYATTKVN